MGAPKFSDFSDILKFCKELGKYGLAISVCKYAPTLKYTILHVSTQKKTKMLPVHLCNFTFTVKAEILTRSMKIWFSMSNGIIP